MADRYISPSPEMQARNRARDVRESIGWTNEWCGGPTFLTDWIGLHPSRDYDLIFFGSPVSKPVSFVYCAQHLRVHSTGWCTVNASQKYPLQATTFDEAVAESKRK